jgi:polyribonucleotide nucleotidyltransferase
MNKTIDAPREDYKAHAPRIVKLRIAREYIGAVIGPGGKIIQEIQRQTGAVISIEEEGNEGVVEISSPDKTSIDKAVNWIKGIVMEPEVGEVYEGKVKTITAFGAFVEFMPGKDGLLHISEISNERLSTMDGVFKEGEIIKVKLVEIDKKTGKYRLSRKVLLGNRPERVAPTE